MERNNAFVPYIPENLPISKSRSQARSKMRNHGKRTHQDHPLDRGT